MLVDFRLRRVCRRPAQRLDRLGAPGPRLYSAQPSKSVIDASSGASALALRIIASAVSRSSPRSSFA